MKKSVIIVLAVVYVMAILSVGIFGLKGRTLTETIYVQSIECTNEDIKTDEYGKFVYIKYTYNPDDPTAYYLQWEITPTNATNKIVEFRYDENSTSAVVNRNGVVVFNKKGSIEVSICSTDGSAVCEHVTIFAK